MSRKSISPTVQTELFNKSMRRCALCYGVNHDFNEKSGQIAHLDQDNSNPQLDNLVWLCLNHHDSYDGKTSQSKNYTYNEVKFYREALYKHVDNIRSVPHEYDRNNEIITNSLNCLMQFIPYCFLLKYIEDFPNSTCAHSSDTSEMWRLYKRDNPMKYPFSDSTLNNLMDSFFDTQSRAESLNCFGSSFGNGNGNEVQNIKNMYISNYNSLTNYIRANYPNVNLNQFKY